MTTATVGQRYQVVIPRAERLRLGLRPSSRVNVEAKNHCLVLYPVTSNGLRGAGKELANGTDAKDYIKKLRAEWSGRQ